MHHRVKARDEVDSLMKLNIDFMFLGSRDIAGETIPVIVVREERTRMTLSSAVPRKTTGRKEGACIFVARRVLARRRDCQILGRRKAIVGGGRWVCENSGVGSSASNGVVERSIQSVQQQVRVLKLALEQKWKMKIPHKHSVVSWIIENSAFRLNRFEVDHDGKTAYERLKGKKAKVLGIGFGETVAGG